MNDPFSVTSSAPFDIHVVAIQEAAITVTFMKYLVGSTTLRINDFLTYATNPAGPYAQYASKDFAYTQLDPVLGVYTAVASSFINLSLASGTLEV